MGRSVFKAEWLREALRDLVYSGDQHVLKSHTSPPRAAEGPSMKWLDSHSTSHLLRKSSLPLGFRRLPRISMCFQTESQQSKTSITHP